MRFPVNSVDLYEFVNPKWRFPKFDDLQQNPVVRVIVNNSTKNYSNINRNVLISCIAIALRLIKVPLVSEGRGQITIENSNSRSGCGGGFF